MSFRLTSPDGDHVFELRRGASLTVGRALTSDVPLLDPTVSRRHASLVVDDSGIELNDLGSSNGTFVNGQRVQESAVNPGDSIQIGPISFVVQIDGVPADEDIHAPVVAAAPAPDPEDTNMAVAAAAAGGRGGGEDGIEGMDEESDEIPGIPSLSGGAEQEDELIDLALEEIEEEKPRRNG